MDRLESDVLNHHKHIHGLILWLKSHAGCALIKDGDHEHVDSEFYYVSGDAFDLCKMFSEGSTVAHEIWKRYEGDWSPSKEESPAKAQNSAMPKCLCDTCENSSICGWHIRWGVVAIECNEYVERSGTSA